MEWKLKSDRPIYTQLLEQIQIKIISGDFIPGQKLPSVRDLALEASVNPNTMQKALSELERSGLVYSQRTAGRFITEDEKMLLKIKENVAREQIQEFVENMKKMGFTLEEIIKLMENNCNEEEKREANE